MLRDFMDFVRKQGVVGLAVAFVLGQAIVKVVASLVEDIIMPLVGLILGRVDFNSLAIHVGNTRIAYGHFISSLVDFLIIAAVIYYGVKWLKLDRLDKKE